MKEEREERRAGQWMRSTERLSLQNEWPFGFVATNLSAGSTKAAKARRRWLVGAGRCNAVLISPRAGIDGTGMSTREREPSA